MDDLFETFQKSLACSDLPGNADADRRRLASFRRRNPFKEENEFTTIMQTCQRWYNHYCIECKSKHPQFIFVSENAASIEQLQSYFTNAAAVTATDLFERFAEAEETTLTGVFVETLLRCGGDYLCQKTVIVTDLDAWTTSYNITAKVLNKIVNQLCSLTKFIDSALKYPINASKVQFVFTGFKSFDDNRLRFRLSEHWPKDVEHVTKLGITDDVKTLPFGDSIFTLPFGDNEFVPIGWHVVYEQCLEEIGLKIREIFHQAEKDNVLSCETLQRLLQLSSEAFAKWHVAKTNKRPNFWYPVESIIFANSYLTDDHYVFYTPVQTVPRRDFNDENINGDDQVKTELTNILSSPRRTAHNASILNTAENKLNTALGADSSRVHLHCGYLPASNLYINVSWGRMQRIIDETILTQPRWKSKLHTDITRAAALNSEPFRSVLFSVQQLLKTHTADNGSAIDYLKTRVNDVTKKLLMGTDFSDSDLSVVIVWMHASGTINANGAEKYECFEVLNLKLYIGIR